MKKKRKRSSNQVAIADKRLPQRTCVACRSVKTKRELVRLVRSGEGNIEIDLTGKKPGRGVYLCPVRKCWEAGLAGKRLEHSLKIGLTTENKKRLMEYAEGLSEGNRGEY